MRSYANEAERVRVAFVVPDLDGGGAQRVALTLLRHLNRQKFEPTLVVFDACGPLAADVPLDVSIVNLRKPRLRQALVALRAALDSIEPEIVFSTFGHVNLALLAMRPTLSLRPRLILREPNTPSASLPTLAYNGLLRIGYRILYPRAEVILCQSRLMADELHRWFGIPSARLYQLANPVDWRRLRDGIGVPERSPGEGRRFIACGSLTTQKGFDRLLPLFARLPAVDTLRIFGEGPLGDELRVQCSDLGIADRVEFAGFVKRPWAWFAGADAVLVPSRWEGQSNVVLEALACGTPVVATPESGGVSEIAALVPRGAVKIAAIGGEFEAAIAAMQPGSGSLRPSLLPAAYAVEEVMRVFETHLLGGGRRGPAV